MATPIRRKARSVLALLIVAAIPVAAGAAERNRAEEILSSAQSEAVKRARNGDLDEVLRLLALNDLRGQPAEACVSDALYAMLYPVGERRAYLPGETVREALTRWLDPPPVMDRPCNNFFRFEPLREEYRNLTGQDWPLEWRKNDGLWRDFAVELLESGRADDPAAVWRRRIADDPQRTELYRLAYLEVVRSFERPIDRALIEPLLFEGNSIAAFDRLVLVRSALSRQEGLVGWRADLDARILEWLTKRDVPSLPPEVIRHLNRWASEMPEQTRQELIHAVVDLLHVSRSEPLLPVLRATNRVYLSKSIRVGYRGMSVNRALTELAAEVALPVWFDDEVLRDESSLQLDARGTWFRVLEDVLAATPYRLAALDRNILWIGRPDAQEQAAAFVARALSKWPTEQMPPAACDFVWPWEDCLASLSDSTHTPIIAPWIGEQPQECRFTCGRLPMAVSLELLTRHQRLDWLQIDGTVVVMPPARCASVRRAVDRHRLRNEFAEAEYRDQPFWKQLEWRSNCSGDQNWSEIEQTAREIDLNLVVPPESGQIAVPWAVTLDEVPWKTLLTVALFETDLDWDTDGALAFTGTKKQVEEFRRRADRRAERRGRVSADIASQLSGKVDLSFDGADRGEIVAWFREIGVSPIPDCAPKALTMHLKDVPLEAALDVLTLQLGLDWFVGAKGIQVR